MEPTVALESTVISHGLPYPANLETARRMERAVREAGAEPRTIAVLKGEVKVGLTWEELEYLARAKDVRKLSRRDLPIAVGLRQDGATTVAGTMYLAARAGIAVFATGGIGGVHRGHPFDVSADLQELARTPVVVVCAGAKAILDLPATLEVLETMGVPVLGYETDEFPAFYSRRSGLPVDQQVKSPEEVAEVYLAQRALGLPTGMLVTVPVPEEAEVPREEVEPAIERAVAEADEKGIKGKALTPFLLARISDLTGERSLKANLALLENNARVAARIALAINSGGRRASVL